MPSGDETWYSSGSYSDTIPNSAGCDSIIAINLTIKNTFAAISPVTCDSYTVPSGKATYTASGIYSDTLPNSAGCDSILTINLTIDNSTAGVTSPAACGSYTVPSGKATYTSGGTYMDTIPNNAGCDSVMTIILTVIKVDTSVSSAGNVLTANATGVTYKWLNCDSGFAVISGATNQAYTPASSGTYAVQITDSGCIDTSSCHNVTVIGVQDAVRRKLSVYPNPAGERIFIDMSRYAGQVHVSIVNILGEEVHSSQEDKTNIEIETSGWAPGIYFVKLKADDGEVFAKVVVENE